MDVETAEGIDEEVAAAAPNNAEAKDPLVEKIIAYEKMKCKARQCFIRADEMSEEIIPQLKKRKRVKISDGRFARIKDNFARKNKAFKQAGIERYEIEILSAD